MNNQHKIISSEIDHLKKIHYEWSLVQKGKIGAADLSRKVESFKHTIEANFEHAKKHFQVNEYTEITMTDGEMDLKRYAKSKLIKKDDKFFHSGKENVLSALENLIRDLEKELEN